MLERLRSLLPASEATVERLTKENEALRAANAVLREERDLLTEQKDGQFDFLLRMEQQRDEWRARFMEQWRQHQNAQGLLEQHIYSVGTVLVAVVNRLNDELKSQGKAPVDMSSLRRLALEGERVLKSAEEYGDAMRRLEATRPKRDASGQILGWSREAVASDLVVDKP